MFRPRIYSFVGDSMAPTAESCWQRATAGLRQRCRELGDDLFSINADLDWFRKKPAGGQRWHPERRVDLATLLRPGDAVVAIHLTESMATRILDHGASVILLTETELRHPRCCSPVGCYEMARTVGGYLGQRLTAGAGGQRGRPGTVLAVGGMMDPGEAGRSRLAGISDGLSDHPGVRLAHIPTITWQYESALDRIRSAMLAFREPFGAVFGLADALALAARDAGVELGLLDQHTPVVGVYGDPMALASIAAGELTATVDIGGFDLGRRVAEIAHRALAGDVLPPHFPYHWRWVDAHEVLSQPEPVATPEHTVYPDNAVAKHAIAYIHRRYSHQLTRREIADALGVHEHYLSRVFARAVGTSLWEYLNWYRIECAKELLRRPAGEWPRSGVESASPIRRTSAGSSAGTPGVRRGSTCASTFAPRPGDRRRTVRDRASARTPLSKNSLLLSGWRLAFCVTLRVTSMQCQ